MAERQANHSNTARPIRLNNAVLGSSPASQMMLWRRKVFQVGCPTFRWVCEMWDPARKPDVESGRRDTPTSRKPGEKWGTQF